jgi:hypothetical protein
MQQEFSLSRGAVAAALVGFALVGLFASVSEHSQVTAQTTIFACSNSKVIDTTKEAIKNTSNAFVHVTAFELTAVEELQYDSEHDVRKCKALAYLSIGKQEIKYSVEWSGDKTKFYVIVDSLT